MLIRHIHKSRATSLSTYTLLVGLISIGIIVAIEPVGDAVGDLMTQAGVAISSNNDAQAQSGDSISIPNCLAGEVLTGNGSSLSCVTLSDYLSRSAGPVSGNDMLAGLDMGGQDISNVGVVTTDGLSPPVNANDLATVQFVQDTLSGSGGGESFATETYVDTQIAAIPDTDWPDITNKPNHVSATPSSCTGADQALRWDGSSWVCGTVTTSGGGGSCTVRSSTSASGGTSRSVSCNSTETMTGGGCLYSSIGSTTEAHSGNYPSGVRTWTCQRDTSSGSYTPRAYVICCTF